MYSNEIHLDQLPRKAFYRLSEERQHDILDTAVRLYADNPYEEVTVRKICEAMSINLNTFYRYFKTKDDLYLYTYYTLISRQTFPEDLEWSLRDFLISEEETEPLYSKIELEFMKSWQEAPAELVHRLIFSTDLNEEKMIRTNMEREIRNGSMRSDLNADLAAYLFSTMGYLLFHYARKKGLSSAEDMIELKRYACYTLFNYGIRGKDPEQD